MKTKEVRPITLQESSWKLIDEAADMLGVSASEILDAVVQDFLATDDGRTLERTDNLAAIKRIVGDNRG